MQDPVNSLIVKKVWFNSGVTYGGDELSLPDENSDSLKVSYRVTKGLESLLLSHDDNIWNNEKQIQVGDSMLCHGAKLTVLSPNSKGVERFKTYIEKKEKDLEKLNENNVSHTTDYHIPIDGFNLDNFKEDSRVENGASIAFMFEYDSKKILFMGDAFPSVVAEGLRETGFIENEQPVEVDYVKLSHHGGRGNLNDELLNLIESSSYIVSTKGCNGRPSKETFARIYKKNKGSMNLYFNYKNENIFSKEELSKNPNIQLIYLSEENYTIGVN
jgi:hypothetical protein